MGHSESLRVIWQVLEAAKIPAFELEAEGPNYVVKCDSLTQTGELVLRHAISGDDFPEQTTRQSTIPRSVRFSLADIFRLDDQAQLQRRKNASQSELSSKLSQLLRSLGNHLERMNASAFQIRWVPNLVAVYFQRLDGQLIP